MTGDARPHLSIVVAATDSPLAVERVLKALEGQADGRIEVLVVGAFRLPLPSGSVQSFSPLPLGEGGRRGGRGQRIIAAPGSGVPRLRRIGLEAARGRVVALTEDSCLAEPGWVEAWLSAFADPSLVAASGAVELDEEAPTLDRAVVFCEYAPFLPPTPAGPPRRLAGNNFAVLREVALRTSEAELHEVALLAAILREGGSVRIVEGATVRHVRRFGWREAFGDRLRFGFEFGRLRTIGLSPIARRAGFFAGPAIFAVQAARLSSTILRNRRHLGRFVRALPITLALLAAWSLGEWAGWCLGPPARDRPASRRRRGTGGRTLEPRPDPADSTRSGCKPAPPVA